MAVLYCDDGRIAGKRQQMGEQMAIVQTSKLSGVPLCAQRVPGLLQQHHGDRLMRLPARDVEHAIVPMQRLRYIDRLEGDLRGERYVENIEDLG